MKDDTTRRMIYGTIVVFLLFLVFWISFVYVNACGLTLTCVQASPLVVRTPIPTLIPAKPLVVSTTGPSSNGYPGCLHAGRYCPTLQSRWSWCSRHFDR